MTLPIIESPKYRIKLSDKEYSFRPFLVKEEKILLIAIESEDNVQIVDSLINILSSCVDEEIDVKNMPLYDVLYLLINIRSKSKGEVVTFGIKCPECEESNKVQLDLEKIKIMGTPKSKKEMVIAFTKNVGVVMLYPTIEVFKSEKDLQKFEGQFDFFVNCIESVYDGEKVHSAKDQTKKEMTDLISTTNEIDCIILRFGINYYF